MPLRPVRRDEAREMGAASEVVPSVDAGVIAHVDVGLRRRPNVLEAVQGDVWTS